MKVQNLVRILILLVILGMVAFPVTRLIAESTEKNSESAEVPEKNSESADVEVNDEAEEKFKEVLDKANEAVKRIEELNTDGILEKRKLAVDEIIKKLREHTKSLNDIEGVKVEISEPTVILEFSDENETLEVLKKKIQELVDDRNLDSDEIKEHIDKMKIYKAAAKDGEIVTVLQYGPNVTTKISKDLKRHQELLDKIKELASDEDLESEELEKKVQDLVKEMRINKFVDLDKDNVKVHTFGPYVTRKILRDPDNLKKLGENIRELSSDENLETQELAEKVIKLVYGMNSDIDTITKHGFEGGKVYQFKSSTPLKKDTDPKIDKLEKRIENLETKIEQLLQKLDESVPESSEEK